MCGGLLVIIDINIVYQNLAIAGISYFASENAWKFISLRCPWILLVWKEVQWILGSNSNSIDQICIYCGGPIVQITSGCMWEFKNYILKLSLWNLGWMKYVSRWIVESLEYLWGSDNLRLYEESWFKISGNLTSTKQNTLTMYEKTTQYLSALKCRLLISFIWNYSSETSHWDFDIKRIGIAIWILI